MFSLDFHTYSGMRWPLFFEEDEPFIRGKAAEYLKRARNRGHSVVTLTTGTQWEIQTQMNINGVFITDEDGILSITENL